MAGGAIRLERVTKRYGKVVALDDLSLSVEHGVFGFLGPNGAGKTTAVKILLGLTRPTTGSGSLAGAAFGSKASLGRIGYLPESIPLYGEMRVHEYLDYRAKIKGVERHRRRGTRSTHSLYARVATREFFRVDRRNPKLHVELPDGTTHDDVFFLIVANADPWTYVGNRPLRPTPDVTLDTGLAIYARRRMGAAGVLYGMARLSGANPRVGKRGAYVAYDLDTLTVRADEPMPVQVDGDLLEPREKLVFRSVPQALRIVL